MYDLQFQNLSTKVASEPDNWVHHKTHSAHATNQKLLGFKTFIKPSRTRVKDHLRRMKENIHKHRNTPQSKLIKLLNPIIRGWANYYRTVCSKRTFNRCDHLVYLKLRSWANRRHPTKSGQWAGQYRAGPLAL